ncbi:hypothetical protein OAW18_05040 [Alphaproteobacteria bacterium]|nr:hypothetical protein [Alphaproteobacteria bacterium]
MRSAKSPECVLCGKLLGKAVPPHQNAAMIGALSKRKIRWQNQNPTTLNPSSVNFKKSTVAPLIIQGLIILTIQPKSSSFAAAMGHSNSSLAFTFAAVRVAANVLPNAENRRQAKDTISNNNHQLQSWPAG